MLERFTRDARRAVVSARDVARRLGADEVQPEHLLLALATGSAPAARAIAEVGLDAAAIAAAIEADLVAMLAVVGVPPAVVDSAPAHPRADAPRFSLHAKRALEHALREAVRRHDRGIGTEHLLLGALRPPAPIVARVLARLDVDPERLAALVQVEVAAAGR